eukprot:1025231-Lingulodinium_polyedra.AAC.1
MLHSNRNKRAPPGSCTPSHAYTQRPPPSKRPSRPSAGRLWQLRAPSLQGMAARLHYCAAGPPEAARRAA